MKLKNKIFISYAKEDISYAERLYDFLLSKNHKPWLDKKKLHVGQNWEFHIQEALHKADFIILLLSKTSVSKRGYVQKEFRIALDFCEYKLDSDIYVLPIKLDDCDIPLKLQKFQYVENNENVFLEILNAIDLQNQALLNSPLDYALGEQTFQITNEVKQGILGEVSPKHIFEFQYPQFNSVDEDSINDLNTIIKNDVLMKMFAVRDNFYKFLVNSGKEYALSYEEPEDSNSFGKIEIKLLNSHLVSLTSFTSEYYTGTPHGMFGTKGLNYLNNPIRKFELEDLFDDQNNFLLKIRDLVHEKLMIIAENEQDYYSIGEEEEVEIQEMDPEEKRNSFYVYENGLEAKIENFENYFFKKDAIVFIYNPYDITAWSQGDHFPEIGFRELLQAFPKEKNLHSFIKDIANQDC